MIYFAQCQCRAKSNGSILTDVSKKHKTWTILWEFSKRSKAKCKYFSTRIVDPMICLRYFLNSTRKHHWTVHTLLFAHWNRMNCNVIEPSSDEGKFFFSISNLKLFPGWLPQIHWCCQRSFTWWNSMVKSLISRWLCFTVEKCHFHNRWRDNLNKWHCFQLSAQIILLLISDNVQMKEIAEIYHQLNELKTCKRENEEIIEWKANLSGNNHSTLSFTQPLSVNLFLLFWIKS